MDDDSDLFDEIDGYPPPINTNDYVFDDSFYNDEFDSDEPILTDEANMKYDRNPYRRIDVNTIVSLKKEKKYGELDLKAETIIEYMSSFVKLTCDIIFQDKKTNEVIDEIPSAFGISHTLYSVLNQEWIYAITETNKKAHKEIHKIIKSLRVIKNLQEEETLKREDIVKKLEKITELLKENYLDENKQETIFNKKKDNKRLESLLFFSIAKALPSSKISKIPIDENYYFIDDAKTMTITLSSDYELEKVSYTERFLMDIVANFVERGRDKITSRDICRVVYGESVRKEKLEETEEMMKKLGQIRCSLEVPEATKKNKKIKKVIYRELLIEYRELDITEKDNPNQRVCYIINDYPVLYRYAKERGQIATVDKKVLDIPNKNEHSLNVMHYLILQIEWMKNPNAQQQRNDTIKFKTMYSDLSICDNENDLTNAEIKATRRCREQVEIILKYWIEIGYIKSYELIKTDRGGYKGQGTYHGVKIFLEEKLVENTDEKMIQKGIQDDTKGHSG